MYSFKAAEKMKFNFFFFKQRRIYYSSCYLVHKSLNRYNTRIRSKINLQWPGAITWISEHDILVYWIALLAPFSNVYRWWPCQVSMFRLASAQSGAGGLLAERRLDSCLQCCMWYQRFGEEWSGNPGLEAMWRYCGTCLLWNLCFSGIVTCFGWC